MIPSIWLMLAVKVHRCHAVAAIVYSTVAAVVHFCRCYFLLFSPPPYLSSPTSIFSTTHYH
eukprot:m.260057 g.260057  ORF g.260057 m.260057 type:complete len:61 (-) comp38062_c0_seq1:50-232(-)